MNSELHRCRPMKPFSPVSENYLFLDKKAHYLRGAPLIWNRQWKEGPPTPTPPTSRLLRDLLRPLGSQSVGIVFIDWKRDSHRARVGHDTTFLAKLFPEAPVLSFFKRVFFLSWIGPASSWEDVHKATSLAMSQKLSNPLGNFIRDLPSGLREVKIKENKVLLGFLYSPLPHFLNENRLLVSPGLIPSGHTWKLKSNWLHGS